MFPANRIATSYKSSTHGILDNFKPVIYGKRATQAEGVRFCLHLTLEKPSLIFKELQPYLRKEKIQGRYFKICQTYFELRPTYFTTNLRYVFSCLFF